MTFTYSASAFFTLWYILLDFFFSIYFQWKKAEEKLERELREAEASESAEKKLKLVGSFIFCYAFNVKLFKLEIYCFNL